MIVLVCVLLLSVCICLCLCLLFLYAVLFFIVRLEERPSLGSLSRWRGLFLLRIVIAVVGTVTDVVVVAVLVRFLKTC